MSATSTAPKADNLPLPPIPEDRFSHIAIDPPWHFRSRAASANPHVARTPQRHYPTMDLAHIAALPIKQIAAPDAHVMLWITGPLIVQGVHNTLFRRWGVKPSSMGFVWVKTRAAFDMDQLRRTPLLHHDLHTGMGFTTRQNAEYVIFGRIGSPRRARADIHQVIVAPVSEHSRKPDEFYRRAEHYCHGPRIDMFAGADRDGWTRWGWGHRDGEGIRPEAAACG
jgi:N6-adenosine-specific RNA methylase IME4